jgi:hypothetical protein
MQVLKNSNSKIYLKQDKYTLIYDNAKDLLDTITQFKKTQG